KRLPTGYDSAHFWADESRELMNIIKITFEMLGKLKNTEFAFEVRSEYLTIMQMCQGFLVWYGGSKIPPQTEKVEIYYEMAIFLSNEAISISSGEKTRIENLKLIGEGSYAKVFKFKDSFYNKTYALKRAKNNLDDNELQRFRREFEEMKKLSSPYILEVYAFNEQKSEYTMEFVDCTLEQYMNENNSKLTYDNRLKIIAQLLKGFHYLHSKDLLHRDISYKNVLVKQYDAINVFKIADFGLVKTINSDLTSLQTEVKGFLNDPTLIIRGFSSYDLLDEIYALTQLFAYILSGKTQWANLKNGHIKKFMEKGMNPDRKKRFQNLAEMETEVVACVNELKAIHK
ncbi:MAG: protein kinase family protein, partial [Culicoidibacterales bacterium]